MTMKSNVNLKLACAAATEIGLRAKSRGWLSPFFMNMTVASFTYYCCDDEVNLFFQLWMIFRALNNV